MELRTIPMRSGQTIRARLQALRASPNSGMFGTNEIFALGASALVLLLVIISYIYFLVPARSSFDAATRERSRLQAFLTSSRTATTQEETTEASVRTITQSLEQFETQFLFDRTRGRMDLYDELNALIRNNSLRNTSGPNYTALEAVGRRQTAIARSTTNKWQTPYPGIAISVTVEGQYLNLRRFVRDIESSPLFVIINAVELERATEAGSASASDEERGSLVSLRLDMATYFQRLDSEL